MGPELPFQAEDVKALKPDAKVDPTVLPSAVVPETAWELDAGAGAAPSLGPFIFSRLVDVRLSQRSARCLRFSRMMMISLPEMRPVRQPRYSLRTRAIFSSRAARVNVGVARRRAALEGQVHGAVRGLEVPAAADRDADLVGRPALGVGGLLVEEGPVLARVVGRVVGELDREADLAAVVVVVRVVGRLVGESVPFGRRGAIFQKRRDRR